MKRYRAFLYAVLIVLAGAASTRAQAQGSERATHDHLLFLGPTEYVKARAGTNASACMVSRRGGDFYPVFFDKAGTHTILPAYADDAVLRLKGATDQEIERRSADIPNLPFQGVLVQDPTLRKFVRIGYCASAATCTRHPNAAAKPGSAASASSRRRVTSSRIPADILMPIPPCAR